MYLASQAGPAVRHGTIALGRAAIVAAVVAALLFALAPAIGGGADVLAAKGGGKQSTTSLAVVVLDGDDLTPSHGERITFEIQTTATDRPFVAVSCWQGSTGVYLKSIGLFPTYLFDPWLTMDSSYWTPGVPASCTARAYYYDKRGNQKDLATLGFAVAP